MLLYDSYLKSDTKNNLYIVDTSYINIESKKKMKQKELHQYNLCKHTIFKNV